LRRQPRRLATFESRLQLAVIGLNSHTLPVRAAILSNLRWQLV